MGISWLNKEQLMPCVEQLEREFVGHIQVLETDLTELEMKIINRSIMIQSNMIQDQEINDISEPMLPDMVMDYEDLKKTVEKEEVKLLKLRDFIKKLSMSESQKIFAIDKIQELFR